MDMAMRPTWAWATVAILAAAASLAPFLVVDVPAVLDYPNHLARFYVLAHPGDPILSRMYAAHWGFLPNLGMDVIGQALLRVFPPDVGGRLLLALSLLAPIVGALVYARAAFGRWTWWSFGAWTIAYNAVFFMGFMNFLLGLGVALAGAALWRILRRHRRGMTAAAIGAVIGVCALLCHLLGFAFFALLVAAQEAEDIYRARREGRASQRQSVEAAGLLGVCLAPAALLYRLTHRTAAHGDVVWWDWAHKGFQLLTPFMIYQSWATVVTCIVVISVAILTWRRATRAPGALFAVLVLAAIYAVAPFAAAGGSFVDTRLPLMAALLLFAGFAPRLDSRAGVSIVAAFTLLVVGRSALTMINWIGHARDLTDLRASLALIEPGSKVLPTQTDLADSQPLRGRTLPHFSRLDQNWAGLALIERHAFWPLLFADPSQQPVIVLPPYSRMADPIGQPTPWRNLSDNPATPQELASYPYLAHWRTRFDYVLLIGPEPAQTPSGLTLLHAGEESSIYRVDHPAG